MASPSTIGAGSIGMTIAGGVMGAYGQAQESNAAMRQLQYKAAIADLNKKIALQNRDWAFEVGERKAGQYGIAAGQRMGSIRAVQAASGLDVGSGSAKDVQESQAKVTRMDLSAIREDAARQAYGYEVAATEEEASADAYRSGARDVRSSKGLRVAGSLLGTATSVADKWLYGRSEGMW